MEREAGAIHGALGPFPTEARPLALRISCSWDGPARSPSVSLGSAAQRALDVWPLCPARLIPIPATSPPLNCTNHTPSLQKYTRSGHPDWTTSSLPDPHRRSAAAPARVAAALPLAPLLPPHLLLDYAHPFAPVPLRLPTDPLAAPAYTVQSWSAPAPPPRASMQWDETLDAYTARRAWEGEVLEAALGPYGWGSGGPMAMGDMRVDRGVAAPRDRFTGATTSGVPAFDALSYPRHPEEAFLGLLGYRSAFATIDWSL